MRLRMMELEPLAPLEPEGDFWDRTTEMIQEADCMSFDEWSDWVIERRHDMAGPVKGYAKRHRLKWNESAAHFPSSARICRWMALASIPTDGTLHQIPEEHRHDVLKTLRLLDDVYYHIVERK
jgi:hypothetical protein